jgi:hypothetical protein
MKKLTWTSILLLSLLAAVFVGCSEDDETAPTAYPPNAPSGLTLAQAVRSMVAISWTDNSTDEDTFQVQRSVDSSTFAHLVYLRADSHSSTDATILANKKYWYKVRSKNANGASSFTTPSSIWTWPAIYDFSTDQSDNFTDAQDNNGNDYVYEWSAADSALKLTVNDPPADSTVHVTSDYTMPNQGWFESRIKVESWFQQSGQAPTEVSMFMELDPTGQTLDNVVGLKISQLKTKVMYYAGDTQYFADTTLAPLTDNTWHTFRFFHQGSHWTLYIDGSSIWNGSIPTASSGNLTLEWQFDRGAGPDDQVFWLDNVSNAAATPGADVVNGSIVRTASHSTPRSK